MPDSPTAEEYCKYGISAAGLRHFYNVHGHASARLTTSDLCHSVIKPLTVPEEWECLPTLMDADRRWYSHEYRERSTRSTQATPPAGTRSMCEVMEADSVTAHFVGKPNVFVSHAWLYLFDDALAALEAFDAACGDEEERFYWFDIFSIDEHATQSMSQTWWSTTFRCPCKHAMRLFELYATVDAKKPFDVCFVPAERQKFEAATEEHYTAFLRAVTRINVADAQAGNPDDRRMILEAVEQMEGR
jgi:hypothetical protein